MSHIIEIIPTCVPLRVQDIHDAVRVSSSFSPALHIDINDGLFAHPRTYPYVLDGVLEPIVIPKHAHMHLMVEDIIQYGDACATPQTDVLIVHVESTLTLAVLMEYAPRWRQSGVKQIGIAFKIDTDIKQILVQVSPEMFDFVLVMSVDNIGKQGAVFDSRAYDAVRTIHALYPEILIAVDGGVDERSIPDLVRYGATRFYVGHAIMQQSDPAHAHAHLLALAKSVVQ